MFGEAAQGALFSSEQPIIIQIFEVIFVIVVLLQGGGMSNSGPSLMSDQ